MGIKEMVRQDILEGLKFAVSRGESLEKAMQSFYNAGYKKEEIEEAARALHSPQVQQPTQPQISRQETPQQVSTLEEPQTQKISFYQKIIKKSKHEKIIILLGVVLFLLLWALVGVYFFKEKIVGLFSGG